jgi:PadR family transcriptional regulator AphA
MNKLSYGLLSILSTEPLTGYDLMLKLKLFKHTTHSAIYPLFPALIEKGYIECTTIEQCGKPDKKLYNITEQGINILKEWIMTKANSNERNDEIMLKIYCIYILDTNSAIKFLDETEEGFNRRLNKRLKSFEDLRKKVDGTLESPNSLKFGAYILSEKVINDSRAEIAWCRWIRDLYDKNENINMFQEKFSHMLISS